MKDQRYIALRSRVQQNLKDHSRAIFLNALECDIPGFIAMARDLNAEVSYVLNLNCKNYTLTIK